ncbi:MAG: hypothetical protein J6A79_04900, partial [Clostridia bacterium]|nr:hypothetical protein [Clostridia bacterium]
WLNLKSKIFESEISLENTVLSQKLLDALPKAERRKEALYWKAGTLLEVGDVEAAAQAYAEIRDYADVSEVLKKDKKLNSAVKDVVTAPYRKVGGIVTLGTYEQDNDTGDGPEPIEWIVLDTDGKKSLLISRYGMDAKPYNEKNTDITWEKCTLRNWLNKDFLEMAFTKDEQRGILTTKVDNGKKQGNSSWNTNGGKNTQDKVFLLSYAEAGKYFGSNSARAVKATEYAKENGAAVNSSNGNSWWWLRSPGNNQNNATNVNNDGSRLSGGVFDASYVVRPAFWLNLESGIF